MITAKEIQIQGSFKALVNAMIAEKKAGKFNVNVTMLAYEHARISGLSIEAIMSKASEVAYK